MAHRLASVTARGTVLAFAPYCDFLAAGTMQGATGEPDEVRILSGAGESGLELGCDYQFKEAAAFPSPAPVCRLAWSKAMWSFRNGLIAAGLVDGQVAVWNPRLWYVPLALPAASSPISRRSFAISNSHCAPGSDTPEDEGYFDRDFPIEIDDDYLSAGMRQGRQATLLHAHGRSGNLAKDVAGEQSEEVDTSDWEVVSNSGGDMIAMFAKHTSVR